MDGDCNIADSSQPARCVAAPARGGPSTSGSCVCFEGSCALHPTSSPGSSTQTCETSLDCTLDPTTAQCEPGIVPAVELRVHYNGPLCECSTSDHRCHFHWIDPVPCRTEKDCWFDDKPVMHAIPRPARLKGHKFRGCHDGEDRPACVKGRCTLEGLTC